MTEPERCPWCLKDALYKNYHDHEWGIPQHDDRALFEMLILEGAQAGLSWHTVLSKRQNYKLAFDDFDANKIKEYDAAKIQELLQNSGIIRNKLKINATVLNAQRFLEVQAEFGSFDKYIWQFVNHQTMVNYPQSIKEVPAQSAESDAMSKALLKRGFKFVGSTICYAFMQATGMVDDHLATCWKVKKV